MLLLCWLLKSRNIFGKLQIKKGSRLLEALRNAVLCMNMRFFGLLYALVRAAAMLICSAVAMLICSAAAMLI